MSTSRTATRVVAAVAACALVAVPSVDAAKKKPPQKKGATYNGVTSQGKTACHAGGQDGKPCKIFAKVSKDGKKVGAMGIYWTAQCEDTNVYLSSTAFQALPISSGKFHRKATYTETLGDGSKAENTVETHGTFKHRSGKYTLTGDFTLASDVTFSDGTTTHCTSPKVTFKAKP
jgi:uncharacterized membrane protein